MWSSDRRRLLRLIAAGALGGCGFRPLYGRDGPAARLAGRIAIGEIRRGDLPDRMTFTLREELRRHFGREAPGATHRLDVELGVEEKGLVIAPDNATTRYNLTARAAWTVTAAGGGAPALTGNEVSVTAYSATATVYATRIAQRDAERRLAVALADRIAIAVALGAGRLPA